MGYSGGLLHHCTNRPAPADGVGRSSTLRRIAHSVVLELLNDLIKHPERRTPLDP